MTNERPIGCGNYWYFFLERLYLFWAIAAGNLDDDGYAEILLRSVTALKMAIARPLLRYWKLNYH